VCVVWGCVCVCADVYASVCGLRMYVCMGVCVIVYVCVVGFHFLCRCVLGLCMCMYV
jgi:hypothetical protein